MYSDTAIFRDVQTRSCHLDKWFKQITSGRIWLCHALLNILCCINEFEVLFLFYCTYWHFLFSILCKCLIQIQCCCSAENSYTFRIIIYMYIMIGNWNLMGKIRLLQKVSSLFILHVHPKPQILKYSKIYDSRCVHCNFESILQLVTEFTGQNHWINW